MVREETDKTASDIQARSFMARTLRGMSKNAKLREKQKWSNEKPKLDNATRLRGIYFIDPEDKEFKETIKNARKKLETPMAPAMPCKICKKNKNGETRRRLMISSLSLHVSWKPVNPQECVWRENVPKIHEDHIAGKGDTTALQYGTQIYSYASSNEDTRSKSSSG